MGTPGGTSPRSSAVPAPEPDTRNPTVKKRDENGDADVELRVVVVVSGRRAVAMAGSQTRKTADWTDLYTHLFFFAHCKYIVGLNIQSRVIYKIVKAFIYSFVGRNI